ncbi:MAG TPA: LuxR family transcriptional regulator [Terriglobia bacterium]|nr:LuxR family transcriptional regulator [Terriglobia bacterium]
MQDLQLTFHRFVDSIASRPDELQLRGAIEDIISTFELRTFAYLLISSPEVRNSGLISNYPPAWTKFYLENHYQDLDPVVLHATRHSQPFIWGPGFTVSDEVESEGEFFDLAAQFGLRHGLTIPIRDDCNTTAAVTFAADRPLAAFQRCIELHLPLLLLISALFHRSARRALGPLRVVGAITLSEREYECLNWASKGKSAWEIGQILGISRRTAAFHLDNMRAKLGVRTVRQAVAHFAADRGSVS